MKLIQYWDHGAPPDEVAAWIESVRSKNADMRYRLYDRDGAAWYIRKHLGPREQRAFAACAVPAMQADYFRLCALKRHGGLYVDADFECLKPFSSLLDVAPHGLIESRHDYLVNGFMLVRAADDAFVNACLELATLNIEHRDIPTVYTATGPGVLNALQALLRPELAGKLIAGMDNMLQWSWRFADVVERARREIPLTDALRRSFDAYNMTAKGFLRPWIGKSDPAYKQSPRHWMNWPGSIYADEPAEASTTSL